MVDIAYIVSHGFAARMVIQTNLLGLLVEAGYRVALIAPDAEDENLKHYCDAAAVELKAFSTPSSFWTQQYVNLRKYFLEDIDENTALREKHLRAVRNDGKQSFLARLRYRLAYLAYRVIKLFPSLRTWFLRRETNQLGSLQAEILLSELSPRLLIATYPVNFTEGMLLKAANDRSNCQTAIHLLSWDNISCKGRFPQLADHYLAWGAVMEEEFISYYNIKNSRIDKVGVPHFDIHLQCRKAPQADTYLQDLNLDSNAPYLFFGMSSPRFAPHEIDIVEWLAEEVSANTFGDQMQLVIRPHPQNVQGNMADTSWLPRLQALNKLDRVGVSFPALTKSKLPWSMQTADMLALSQLLASCLVSLNSGSTLSIDALMCGKPVILTAFDGEAVLDYWSSARRLIDYPHLRKLVNTGGISVVDSYDACKSVILQYQKNADWQATRRTQTLERYCELPNERSTERVVGAISKMIGVSS